MRTALNRMLLGGWLTDLRYRLIILINLSWVMLERTKAFGISSEDALLIFCSAESVIFMFFLLPFYIRACCPDELIPFVYREYSTLSHPLIVSI